MNLLHTFTIILYINMFSEMPESLLPSDAPESLAERRVEPTHGHSHAPPPTQKRARR